MELVTDAADSDFGTPLYYDITANGISNRVRVHHSRIIKMIGRELPGYERLAENYWGASELEHAFAELRKRDDTSANIAFLIFLANVRVFKQDGLSQLISIGDQEAASKVVDAMRKQNMLMANTGTLALDKDEDFQMQGFSGFDGLNSIYESFMLDIAGAAEIPVDKLFGRSPTGFNGGAETLQNYYDSLQEKQETDVREPLERLIKIITMSTIGEIPDDLELVFNPIRRPADLERADLMEKMFRPVADAYGSNMIDKATALKELKQQSPLVGMWTNITDEMIDGAEKEAEQNKLDDEDDEKELKELLSKGGAKNSEKETDGTIDEGTKKNAG